MSLTVIWKTYDKEIGLSSPRSFTPFSFSSYLPGLIAVFCIKNLIFSPWGKKKKREAILRIFSHKFKTTLVLIYCRIGSASPEVNFLLLLCHESSFIVYKVYKNKG